jgi:hypothetical protein
MGMNTHTLCKTQPGSDRVEIMKAQNLAALIDHVATSVRTGRMSLKLYNELSTDLWQLATDLDIREEVDEILQNISEEEMTVAMNTISHVR